MGSTTRHLFLAEMPSPRVFLGSLGLGNLVSRVLVPGGEVPCVLVSARMRSRLAPLPASASALVGGFAMMMGLFLALGDVTWNYEVKP